MTAVRIGRRGVLVGIVGSLLAACGLGGGSDKAAVTAALREAVEALPEHLDGEIDYQDSATAGTFISGNLSLEGTDRESIETSLLRVLMAVSLTYQEQPQVRTASVLIQGHPEGTLDPVVKALDVVPSASDTNLTTDDLADFFGE